ncbi:MAG: SLC13 family permease [bacterium]|nr:SLC13 family permease [bacterium]
MSSQELILIAVIIAAFVLIIRVRLRPDLVALLVLLTLGFTGVVTTQEALSGFSRSAVITIIGLFIITDALEETGVIQWLAKRINNIGGGSEKRLLVIFMAAGAGLSLIMNNIAAGAMLLPAAVRVGRSSNVRLSKLLIPVSFGTLVGGMATYLTTANIIMSGLLIDRGEDGLNMLSFIPTGGLIVLATIVYMALWGRRFLPNREGMSESVTSSHLYDTYELGQRLWEIQVQPESRLVDCPLEQSEIGEKLGLTVLGIWRGHRAILSPQPSEVIQQDDYLLVLGREERVEQLEEWGTIFRHENFNANGKHNYDVDLFEVVIPPRSSVIGKTLTDINFRKRYGLTAVALWREGRSYRTDVGKRNLQVGDALLVVGPTEKFRSFGRDRDFLVLNGNLQQPTHPEKAAWAVLITTIVIFLSIVELVPLPLVMMAGAVGMILTGCLNLDEAYQAVEWRVVFLIAGMLPISIAMVNTGLAGRIGEAMVGSLQQYGPLALIAGIFALTVIVCQVIGGQVTALVVGPIAVSAALQTGVNPQAVAVAVAIGCSTAFLTPIAHPVNVLMMGPAGYTFNDFFKVGVGMTVVTFIALLAGMVLFWGV